VIVRCTYCSKVSDYVDSAVIYNGRSFGMMYLCRPCDAYVGVHKGTDRPFGTLANRATREARKKAHATFDPIWKNRLLKRKEAYALLADKLGVEEIHIGESDVDTCEKIITASRKIWRECTEMKEAGK
jgi:hypothetical protein